MQWIDIVWRVVYGLIMIGVLMTLASYGVLAERKVSAWIQGRVGPNRTSVPFITAIPVIGPWLQRLGIWQPLADGLKFLLKEEPIPGHVNKFYFILAPLLSLAPALITVIVVPFGEYWDAEGNVHPLILANIDIGMLFIVAISSLGVYGIVLAGWSSNNKYSYFGGIRSAAQMISYELALGLSLLPVFMWVNAPGKEGGLLLYNIVKAQEGLWLIFLQPISALVFLVALFAETNRLPFDMPETETELVGGYHTEYGSFKLGFLLLSEYINMIVGSAVFSVLFLGGWHFLPFYEAPWPSNGWGTICSVIWFCLKIFCVLFFFMWIRWTLPRFRYDQVMKLGWNVLIPLSVGNLLFYIVFFGIMDR